MGGGGRRGWEGSYIRAISLYTEEFLYEDTPEMRKCPLIRTSPIVPATQRSYEYKITPEMRTPPLIRTLEAVPRASSTS